MYQIGMAVAVAVVDVTEVCYLHNKPTHFFSY
jgi:hypothetical protein